MRYIKGIKVKKAKIRSRYNQVPHLTRDTIWENDKNTRKNTGLRSAVGNVSGNRCESDCRSRVVSSIMSHTLVEIDHAIISTVILLPSAKSFKKAFCRLQAKVCAHSTG